MSDERQPTGGGDQREISDLVGAELVGALGVSLLVVLACFFFIGPVVGIIALLAAIVGFGWYLVSAIRRADTPD